MSLRLRTSADLLDLTGHITRDSDYPSSVGGFANVYKGVWHGDSAVTTVAVKAFRSQIDNTEYKKKLNKRWRRELLVWRRLDHPNVVPLYGITSDFGDYNCMVCPWMDNGTLTSYLKNNKATLSLSGRFKILNEMAAGLSYLHLHDVIHGDLTGSNVLIDGDGEARLCDFGLSQIIAEFQGTSFYSSSITGQYRWGAIELYRVEEGQSPKLTAACDIYSFGSLMLQVLTGEVPYFYLRTDPQVLAAVGKGVRPRRPFGNILANEHWDFIQRCWADHNSGERPTSPEVSSSIMAFFRSILCDHDNDNDNEPLPARWVVVEESESEPEPFEILSQSDVPSLWEMDDPLMEKLRRTTRFEENSTKASRRTQHSPNCSTLHFNKFTQTISIRYTVDLQTKTAQRQRELIVNEVSNLRSTAHPNVARLFDACLVGRHDLWLTMEDISGIRLSNIIKDNDLKEDQVSCVCRQTCKGLQYLHDLGIFHGNLRSQNVLIDSQGYLKLTDFGLCTNLAREQSGNVDMASRCFWMAPELVIRGVFAAPGDIWSLGIMVIEMLQKQPPYFHDGPHTALCKIANLGTPMLSDIDRYTEELRIFLKSCLIVDVDGRTTAAQLLRQTFLASARDVSDLVPLMKCQERARELKEDVEECMVGALKTALGSQIFR